MSWAAMSKSGRPKVGKYQDFDDSRDTRVPLHNDEAFMHGLSFTAKFIGSLEVPRPTSRIEIVACMRRIRYEYKAKAYKKTKCRVNISVSGVKVTKYRKKKKKRKKKAAVEQLEPEPPLIIESPIYRIFYVSHDSLNRNIFSYIARVDTGQNKKTFVCAVFKAYKKSHALRIVRTIGQAFDVCCKLQQSSDALNIPGLLPPERLKKLKEGKTEGEEEGNLKEDTDSVPLEAIQSPVHVEYPLETHMPKLVSFDDEFKLQLVQFTQQLYATEQAVLLQVAAGQQRSEEHHLLQQFNITQQQLQHLLLKFRLPGYQADADKITGTTVNLGRHDTLRSSSGLPSHPPNSLKFQPRVRQRPLNITENQQYREDSAIADTSATAAAAGSADQLVATEQLVDTSIPEEDPANNPFTGGSIVSDDDESMKPQTSTEFAQVQQAQAAQLQLLKDQLSSETAARVDSQAKVHHLLEQNRQLAGHVLHLVAQIKRLNGEPDLVTGASAVEPAVLTEPAETESEATALPLIEPLPASVPPLEVTEPPPASEPSNDMSLLAEVLAASAIQSRDDSKPFMPEREAAVAGGKQNGERFSPFPFNPDTDQAGTSTPAKDENGGPGDGKFSPFDEFKTSAVPPPDTEERFSPFEEFKPVSEPTVNHAQPAGSSKPVVLFELPKAPTPLSDIENEEGPLYRSGSPAYMPLNSTADDMA